MGLDGHDDPGVSGNRSVVRLLPEIADSLPSITRAPLTGQAQGGPRYLSPRLKEAAFANRGLVLELELRVELLAAEAIAPRCVDAVAIPHDQIDALRDGDGQVDADAGEGAARQVMAREVESSRR